MLKSHTVILKKFKAQRFFGIIEKRSWIIFGFFAVIIFFLFRDLFNSYFEADEWFHFTYYFPLTRKPDGLFDAVISTFINAGPLSGGQHVIPVASAIYFLNTKFFGLNYEPYAFMSLLLHSLNSFLVFLLLKTFLSRKDVITKNIFGILSGIFFALSPQSLHTITGAAPFYGQNILSVTFFLLCVISFKQAYISKAKKFIYLSLFFLFLALFTKETAVFLFVLLPLMSTMEKRDLPAGRQVFTWRFLGKVFLISVIIYATFRFLIPGLYGAYLSSTQGISPSVKAKDTGTIVSTDLSFHKNLPGEVLFRTVTFPIRLTGTVFLPRYTAFSIVEFITPIVVPLPDSSARLGFLHGAGTFVVIYLAALGILIFCLILILGFIRKKSLEDARTLIVGLTIIILSALPLVAIIFSFPRWGYDSYFDSRFYYNPTVGAAIVFPFLIFGIASFFSKRKVFTIASIIFLFWLINNMYVLNIVFKQFVNIYSKERKEVIVQLKKHLPELPEKVVFYTETDGLSAFGPALPFYTSVPQAFMLAYYDRDPLPDGFFNKPLFEGKSQGYAYAEGRGLGYFTSKKELSEALVMNQFKTSDIYAFYYEAQKVKFSDITSQLRAEMGNYLKETDILKWRLFEDDVLKIRFLYPESSIIDELSQADPNIAKALLIKDSQFSAEMLFVKVSPSFNIHDSIQLANQEDKPALFLRNTVEKDVFFDKYHFNKVIIAEEDAPRYFIRLNDMLVYLKTDSRDIGGIRLIERVIGSLEAMQ